MRLKLRVGGGLLARETLPDRRQLRLRRVEGRAGREQAEHGDRRPGPRRMRVVDDAQRRPHLVRDRERETLAHHADDGHVFRPELHAPAEHSGVTPEPRPPDVVADHRDRRRTGALVGLHQHAPHERRAIRDAKGGGGDLGDLHGTGVSLRHDQVARHVTPRPQLRHGPQRAAPDVEVVQRALLGTLRRDVPVADLHEAVALGQRQGRVHEDRHHLEDDRPDADRECHRQPADDGQAGILHEHPAAEFQVEHEGLEAGQAAAIAMGFPDAGHTADPGERLAARFVRCHAGADVVVRVQIDVALQLVGEVPLAGAGPNEAGDSRPPRAQRSRIVTSLRSPPGSAS